MSSIITRVVLPGLGAVCPECLSRGNLPAVLPSSRGVSFFDVTEPQMDFEASESDVA